MSAHFVCIRANTIYNKWGQFRNLVLFIHGSPSRTIEDEANWMAPLSLFLVTLTEP